MSDIFISYASADRKRVEPLAKVLEEKGWDVWWDRVIPAGSTFDKLIQEALDEAKCVLVVWSKHSVNSRWVLSEAEEGAARQILVPVLIDEVRIPLAFRRIHAASFFNWKGDQSDPQVEQLLGDLIQHLGPPPLKDPGPPGIAPKSKKPPLGKWMVKRKGGIGILAFMFSLIVATVGYNLLKFFSDGPKGTIPYTEIKKIDSVTIKSQFRKGLDQFSAPKKINDPDPGGPLKTFSSEKPPKDNKNSAEWESVKGSACYRHSDDETPRQGRKKALNWARERAIDDYIANFKLKEEMYLDFDIAKDLQDLEKKLEQERKLVNLHQVYLEKEETVDRETCISIELLSNVVSDELLTRRLGP